MVDSTTAIEIVKHGPNQLLIGLGMLVAVWLMVRIKQILFGDE